MCVGCGYLINNSEGNWTMFGSVFQPCVLFRFTGTKPLLPISLQGPKNPRELAHQVRSQRLAEERRCSRCLGCCRNLTRVSVSNCGALGPDVLHRLLTTQSSRRWRVGNGFVGKKIWYLRTLLYHQLFKVASCNLLIAIFTFWRLD